MLLISNDQASKMYDKALGMGNKSLPNTGNFQ